ncbi:hypothetical protein P4361_18695 [Fictibacillus sp. B-59209]|uniref:GH39 family glycosyl hydrolase n=1 Tax=Fictibacillus sp. B-59209 TaxID=3024873 RepID=UPI002E1D5B61|nr:hypothetical protein [Fictibacillus sp. B-59209]
MADININLKPDGRRIKPVHGVNNGPVCYGALIDVTDYYKKLEVPMVRLHDPNWPHPREVDIHTIFPDFNKDPSDPASYDFSKTDEYIQTVLNTGASIVYRLGESIEHTEKKYYVHPPKDYVQWAEICIGVIRHYNEGWADGFHYGIEYWEIWNEPDYGTRMWSGTDEDYYQFYEVVSVKIKERFPHVKVGGYAAAVATSDFFEGFLVWCEKKKLPLDFFSWHIYTDDPLKVQEHAIHVRKQLDAHGYKQSEVFLNEWNFFDGDWETIWLKGSERKRKELFTKGKGTIGSSFSLAVLLLLQDCPIDMANYYDAQPTALFCGLFDAHGLPQKTYYAFEAFSELSRHPLRIKTDIAPSVSGLYCCGGQDGDGNTVILISNYNGERREYSIDFNGGANHSIQVLAVDEIHNLELMAEKMKSEPMKLAIGANSALMLKMAVNREGTYAGLIGRLE